MSQYVTTGERQFTAAAARSANLRVYSSSGTLTTAGVSNQSIGVQPTASLAATDKIKVRLRTAPGTDKMVAAGAITEGNTVYAAASGKVDATGTIVEGIALEASATDGDVIEVMPTPNTDISAATTGTTAVGFEVDSDSATPKIKLMGVAGGSGDYTTTIVPEATLSADNSITCPEADGDVLAAAALAQTLTNKTLAAPVVTGAADGVTITKIVPFIENGTNTIHTGTVPIPAGAILNNIQVVNTVLWGAASAALDVGDDDDANGYFAAVDCKATDLAVGEVLETGDDGAWGGTEGAYLTSAGRRGGTDTGNSGPYYGASNNIIGVMTVGTPAATTGRSFMAVTYTLPESVAAVATGP